MKIFDEPTTMTQEDVRRWFSEAMKDRLAKHPDAKPVIIMAKLHRP